jgi:hypothetical protein
MAMTAWACAETSANMGKDWHCLFGKGTKNRTRLRSYFFPRSQKKPLESEAALDIWGRFA